ncbi:32850_t:CDS:1, partial [Gigaspora margarita]
INAILSHIIGTEDEAKNIECIQVTFHVHLPPQIEKFGEPVVVGSCRELGRWIMVTILLTQPSKREHPTYWRSHPIEISLGEGEIKYKYGSFNRSKGRVEYEGEGGKHTRTLDTRTNDQYDIWQNNKSLYIVDISDFAFVKCIYNAVNTTNFKDK